MTDKTRGILLVRWLLGFLTVSASVAGCGGDGNDLAQFTGTWSYTQSMLTVSCTGQADQSGSYGGSKQWNQGVTSDLVDMTPSPVDLLIAGEFVQCFYTFDVKDKKASIHAGQTCTFPDATGASLVDETPTSWTFTLTSATEGEEVFNTSLPPCTLTGMATLKKVAASN